MARTLHARTRMLNRSKPLRRTNGLKRTPMKRQNKARAAKRREECFAAQADVCRRLPCCACWMLLWGERVRVSMAASGSAGAHGLSDPHHEPSRGAGGKDKDTVPLCRVHHDERHSGGLSAFEARYHVDLQGQARALAGELSQ